MLWKIFSLDFNFSTGKRGAIKKANQRGLPGLLLFSFLEWLVGLGNATEQVFLE